MTPATQRLIADAREKLAAIRAIVEANRERMERAANRERMTKKGTVIDMHRSSGKRKSDVAKFLEGDAGKAGE